MKVKITRQCWVEGANRPIGEVLELDSPLARQLIGSGQAVETDEKVGKPKAAKPAAKEPAE